MRDSVTEQLLLDLAVITPEDSEELREVYRAAVEGTDLMGVDYCTIRDLTRIANAGDAVCHLLLIALFNALREGSVRISLNPASLRGRIAAFAGVDAERYIDRVEIALSQLSPLIYSVDHPAQGVITSRDSFRPLVIAGEGDDRYLYFHKYYAAERRLREAITRVLAWTPQHVPEERRLAEIMREVLIKHPVTAAGKAIALNDEQKAALLASVMNCFTVISGGPGTGKTFIVLNLLRVMVRLGIDPERMRIAAPTGRAAQKLADAVRRGVSSIKSLDDRDRPLAALEGVTIHRLLGYRPSRNDFIHTRFNPLRADLVVVDEASMIDIVLIGNLFEALDEHTRIVLLGDRNQLPSVDAGAVLADLIPEDAESGYSRDFLSAASRILPEFTSHYAVVDERPMRDRIAILVQSYRSEESIQRAARGIIEQDPSAIDEIQNIEIKEGDSFPEAGVWIMEPSRDGDGREIAAIIKAWAAHYRGNGEGDASSLDAITAEAVTEGDRDATALCAAYFSRLEDFRALSPTRSGAAGTNNINRILMQTIAPQVEGGPYYPGLPVLVTANDYAHGLFNGDVGCVMRSISGGYRGVFRSSEGFVSYPIEALPAVEPAYAITVHKSQGSEYGSVLFLLSGKVPASLLTVEVLYTGLTRARRSAVIYASRDTLKRALCTRTKRESGIRFT